MKTAQAVTHRRAAAMVIVNGYFRIHSKRRPSILVLWIRLYNKVLNSQVIVHLRVCSGSPSSGVVYILVLILRD